MHADTREDLFALFLCPSVFLDVTLNKYAVYNVYEYNLKIFDVRKIHKIIYNIFEIIYI